MIETYMRSLFQPLFDRLGRFLMALRLTPNSITLLALATGIASAYCLWIGNVSYAFALLVISGLFDILDGTVARLSHNMQKVGAYMDHVVDRLVESAIIFGFFLRYGEYASAYLAFMAATLFHFSTYMVANALFANMSKSATDDKSIIERAEAFAVFGIMMWYPEYIYEILMAFSAATFLSGVARFIRVWSYARETKSLRKKRKATAA